VSIFTGVGAVSTISEGHGYSSGFQCDMRLFWIVYWIEKNSGKSLKTIHGVEEGQDPWTAKQGS